MSRTSPFPDDAVPPWAGVVVAAVLLTAFLVAVHAIKSQGDRHADILRAAAQPVPGVPAHIRGKSIVEAIRETGQDPADVLEDATNPELVDPSETTTTP